VPYLIDGNNLLGSWGGPRSGQDRREEVVRRVAELCRRRGMRAAIVFDGAPLRGDHPEQSLGLVSIQVPPPGRDADSVIRDIVDRASQPRDWTVVTSDKPLYSYVRTRGAKALHVREWNALEREGATTPAARARREPNEKPDREQNVDEWLRLFSKGDAGSRESK
jgi:predicted RNA-binding protein with PIN domain